MAANTYKLNGVDMFTAYGYALLNGSNTMLQLRKRKAPLTNNWPEENGLEYDLTEIPRYEDRIFVLSGWIIASSRNDFFSKYNALFNALNVPGALSLECIEIATTVHVMYSDMTSVRLTRMQVVGGKVVVKIDLTLNEVQQYI